MFGHPEVSKRPDGSMFIHYKKVTYIWNDIIDPNSSYGSDVAAAWTLGWFYNPKDYVIKLVWDASATCTKDCNGKVILTGDWAPTGYPFE